MEDSSGDEEAAVAENFELRMERKPPDSINKFAVDKIPAFEEGSELLLMCNPIVSNLANDALRGTNDAAMLTSAQVTYWMVRFDNNIFPTTCIGFLTSINGYLMTKTFLDGVRGHMDKVSGNVSDLRTQYI